MIELFWGCLIGGIVFALLSLFAGDAFGDGLDLDGAFEALPFDAGAFLQPMVLVGGLTAFGGAGVLLTRYTDIEPVPVVLLALTAAAVLSTLVYFAYVKPMRNSESSIGYSMKDYVGRIGEVFTPIPARGCGEVLVKMGPANTFQTAASFDEQDIPAGRPIVVVEVRDNLLYVTPFEDKPSAV